MGVLANSGTPLRANQREDEPQETLEASGSTWRVHLPIMIASITLRLGLNNACLPGVIGHAMSRRLSRAHKYPTTPRI
jgi:hypothetical protein